MQRWALGIEYLGEGFLGWQSQPGGRTVQDVLEAALGQIAGQPLRVSPVGRTDTGVHARLQIVHFDAPQERPRTAWVRGVNAMLPRQVSVRWATPVPREFHARAVATGRHYQYLLQDTPVRPGLNAGRVGWFHQPLDLAAMQTAASLLVGRHDFSAFRAAECQAPTPVRELRRFEIGRLGEFLLFTLSADAFLHHMVRNLVGMMIFVGKGRHGPEWVATVLASRDRRLAAPTFAPDGLDLVGADYDARWGLPEVSRPWTAPP